MKQYCLYLLLSVKSKHHSTDLVVNEQVEALQVFLSKEAGGWVSSVPQSLSLASPCL